jgi:hypothetical protein
MRTAANSGNSKMIGEAMGVDEGLIVGLDGLDVRPCVGEIVGVGGFVGEADGEAVGNDPGISVPIFTK